MANIWRAEVRRTKPASIGDIVLRLKRIRALKESADVMKIHRVRAQVISQARRQFPFETRAEDFAVDLVTKIGIGFILTEINRHVVILMRYLHPEVRIIASVRSLDAVTRDFCGVAVDL